MPFELNTFILFGAIAVVIAIVNFVQSWRRTQRLISERPECESGYTNLFVASILAQLLPALIVSLGLLNDSTLSLIDYINPASSKIYVVALWSFVLSYSILPFIWVQFGGGSDFFERHPGFLTYTVNNRTKVITTTRGVKIFFASQCAVVLAAAATCWHFFSK